MHSTSVAIVTTLAALCLIACGDDTNAAPGAPVGSQATGGSTSLSATTSASFGGASGVERSLASGGTRQSSRGDSDTDLAGGAGGFSGLANGGALTSGGTLGLGSSTSGGRTAMGGTKAVGGTAAIGGTKAVGGTAAMGGTKAVGGTAATGTGGASTTRTGANGGEAMGGSGDYWGGLKNPPRKSAGCDKPAMITIGKKTILSGGVTRSYVIDIPAGYDPAKPYRLFYVSHGLGGKAEDVAGWDYFGLKAQATAANDPAIFVAGQGLNNTWGEVDHVFFDDVTAFVKDGLCIDVTRVFVTGMSMGGMYTYSLSADRQKAFRAGVGIAPTNYNIWLPNPKLTDPIAWMQTTGMSDTYCPWSFNEAQKKGSKFIALEKAANNGCTIPATIPTWTSGNHLCYDFVGCKPGYPVKACTFDGPHTDNNRDPGSSVNWIAKESWDFFTQF